MQIILQQIILKEILIIVKGFALSRRNAPH